MRIFGQERKRFIKFEANNNNNNMTLNECNI